MTRVARRLLVLAACVWHTWAIEASSKRSLITYDYLSTSFKESIIWAAWVVC